MENAPSGEGFPRRVVEGDSAGIFVQPQWAPDGTRFTFGRYTAGRPAQLVLASASGSTTTPLEPGTPGATYDARWSSDSQWILYLRSVPETQEVQVAKIRPGASGAPEILASYKASERERLRQPVQWSPKDNGILAYGSDGLYLMSLDYKTERKLASGIFNGPLGFSKDGSQVLGLFPNGTGEGAAWRLISYDVATGASKLLAEVDLPLTTSAVRGFSLHPDGTRFATSIAKWEGFE